MANCIGAGLCRCVHYYDDGNPVSGSGSSADPYVHEKQVITSIRDFITGTPLLVADTNRVITLPASVRCLYDASNDITHTPDASGCVTITTTGMTNFTLGDGDASTTVITNGETVRFGTDGGGLTGYNNNGYDDVQLSGNDIIIPTLKTRSTTNFAGLSFSGAVLNDQVTMNVDVTCTKDVTLMTMTTFEVYNPGTTASATEIIVQVWLNPTFISQQLGQFAFKFDTEKARIFIPAKFLLQELDADTASLEFKLTTITPTNPVTVDIRDIRFSATYI